MYVVGAGLVVSRPTPRPAQPKPAIRKPSLIRRPFDTSLVDTEWPFEMTSLLSMVMIAISGMYKISVVSECPLNANVAAVAFR